MRNFRFYFVLGSVALLVQLLLAVWGYRVVTELDTETNGFPDQYHQDHVTSKNKNNHDRTPDGSFNGYPVFYHDLTLDKTYHSRPYSSIRCVGENYQGSDFAWMHRSCHFRFLCFNISSREFEIYSRPDDETFESVALHRPFMDLSSSVIPPHDKSSNTTGSGVSLGSGTVRYSYTDGYDGDDSHRQETQKWFPTVVRSSPPERYYALEEDLVFVPFHSETRTSQERQCSVVWDDLFPIYNLLSMFQLASPDKEALLMRTLPLSGSKENSDENASLQRHLERFRSLMLQSDKHKRKSGGQRPYLGMTNWTSQFEAMLMSCDTPPSLRLSAQNNMSPLQSGLVCAKDGVAGLGPHGIRYMKGKNHRVIFHNQGRGSLLWSFRSYCLENLGLSTSSSSQSVVRDRSETGDSKDTSSDVRIVLSAQTQLSEFLSSAMIHHDQIEIESHDFSNDEDIVSRIKLMIGTTVFMADCSDATTTAALFLPKGASMVLLFNDNHGGDETSESACLEYKNLLNNLSHVFVHWLPVSVIQTQEGREILLDIVQRATRLK